MIRIFFCSLLFTIVGFSQPLVADELRPTPNWSLQTEAGETLSSESLKGSPLILHFWATWCPYCKKLQPGLEALYQKHRAQGLKLVGISFREDEGATPQAVLQSRGLSFVTAIDGDTVALQDFGIKGTPTTFFIYPDGRVLGMTTTSDPNDPALATAVEKILSQ